MEDFCSMYKKETEYNKLNSYFEMLGAKHPTFQVSDKVGNKRTQHNTSNFISIDVMYIMSDEITNTADVIIMLNK